MAGTVTLGVAGDAAPDPQLALLARARSGDAMARAEFTQANLGLVRSVVARYAPSYGPYTEDLFQVGVVGLIKAMDRFNLDLPVRFSTYAVPLILGEIRRHLRDDGPIHVARSLQERSREARRVEQKLAQQTGREPTAAQVAAAMGVTADLVVEALESSRPPTSLHEPVRVSDSGSAVLLADQLPAVDELGPWVDKVALREVLTQLDLQARTVLVLRYFRDLSQVDVGRALGISQAQVSRVEKRALARVREWMQQ